MNQGATLIRRPVEGEPATPDGKPLPCSQCDLRALLWIGDEPRCGRHMSDKLPSKVRQALAVDRARAERLRSLK